MTDQLLGLLCFWLSLLFAVWVVFGNPMAIIQPNKYGFWPITLAGLYLALLILGGFFGAHFGVWMASQLFSVG